MAEDRHVEVRGARLRIRITGPEGAPWLTLLHSLATSGTLWEAEANRFAATHRVLRIDARGHGGSEATPAPYDFAGLAADVVAVWDALGIARSAVLGLSMGGMTAFHLALDHADRVTAFIAADCRADAPEFFRRMWDDRRALLADQGMEGLADATLPTWLTPRTREQRPDLVARVRAMILATDPEGYRGATTALEGLDVKRRLADIRTPALLIVGAQDGPHPAEMRTLADLIPDAGFVEIADAAHLSNLEQPEDFGAVVAIFLSKGSQTESMA